METIGFSTGALGRADFRTSLEAMREFGTRVAELSALRMSEVGPLLDAIHSLDLSAFSYVSIHAPSSFTADEEGWLAEALLPLAQAGWPVVVHPDTIHSHERWAPFGRSLCIENMDKRKAAGRTVAELECVFEQLPDASLCFDIAHARQCDPSMTESFRILRTFGSRLKQVHMSDVDVTSRHVPLTWIAIRAFAEVAELIPADVPVILESPVRIADMADEVHAALEALGRAVAIAQ
jgi:hypothetical protein